MPELFTRRQRLKFALRLPFYESTGNKILPEKPFGLLRRMPVYTYSGPVAAYAYRENQGQKYDAVIVISPCHVEISRSPPFIPATLT
jgi:predicted class III extradiol MEMO1 family dioxygenase